MKSDSGQETTLRGGVDIQERVRDEEDNNRRRRIKVGRVMAAGRRRITVMRKIGRSERKAKQSEKKRKASTAIRFSGLVIYC